MRVFKSVTTVQANRLLRRVGVRLWQRGYYEHVIRNEVELDLLRGYIEGNPSAWAEDEDNLVWIGG